MCSALHIQSFRQKITAKPSRLDRHSGPSTPISIYLVGVSSLILGLNGIPGHGCEEGPTSSWRCNLSVENILKRDHLAEQDLCLVFILRYCRPGQIDAREKTASARIGQDFSSHLYIGTCGRVPTNRTGRGRDISTKFEVAGEQVL